MLLLALVVGGGTSFGQDAIFYESFDTNTGEGGNDGKWGSISGGSTDIGSDKTGWQATKGYGASKCVRFGTAKAKGSIISPEITLDSDATLTFRAGAWSKDAKTIDVSVSNGNLVYEGTPASTKTITLSDGAFSDYTMTITGVTGTTKITFTAKQTSKNRFFLDEVKIVKAEEENPKTATTTTFGETVDGQTITVNEGEEGKFTPPTATLTPAEAGSLTYSSSNTNVATVDDNGNITFGIAFGETTITASFAGDDTYAKSSAFYTLNRVEKQKNKSTLSFGANVDGLTFNVLQTEEDKFTSKLATLTNEAGETIQGTIVYSSSNENVATVDATTGIVTFQSTPGTVKIIALFTGNDEYNSSNASYTINYIEVKKAENIADFITKGTTDNDKNKLYRLTLTNAKVLYTNTKSGDTYVRDASGAIDFYNTGLTFTANDIVNGTIIAKYDVYKNLPELVKADSLTTAEHLTITSSDEAAEPKVIDWDKVANYACDLVTLKDGIGSFTGSGSSKKYYTSSGDVKIQFYDKFKVATGGEPYTDAVMDITGIIVPFGDVLEIVPIAKYGILYKFDETKANATYGASDVKLAVNRTLSSEYWNTFCVPFDLSAEKIASVFGNATITKYSGTTEDGVMNFSKVSTMERGVPYLIKPETTVENPTFTGISLINIDAKAIGTDYQFVGTYSPVELATDGTELFIGKTGNLFIPAEGKNKINGMRAYIKLASATQSAKICINGGLVTAIDGVELEGMDNVKVFNLNGQCVGNSVKGLKKGLYIVNGKKLMINK